MSCGRLNSSYSCLYGGWYPLFVNQSPYANINGLPNGFANSNINGSKAKTITSIINANTNKDLLKELLNGWKYVTRIKKETSKNINNINNNDKNARITKELFKKNTYVSLIIAPECVGTINKIEENKENGNIRYKVRMKCKCFRWYNGTQLQCIPRGEYDKKSPIFDVPQDFQRYLIVNLVIDNQLGIKLFDYARIKDNDDDDVSGSKYNEIEYELIERLDASIARYQIGMLSNHSSIINQIKIRLHPYLQETRRNDKQGRSRLRLERRKNKNENKIKKDMDDEKQVVKPQSIPTQLPTSTLSIPIPNTNVNINNTHLWQFMNQIKKLIDSLNKIVNKNDRKNKNYDFSIIAINSDMDICCLKLYHILRYFASQSVQRSHKHGGIFDSRDRDSDRIIASWILYKFQTCLVNGKYKEFVNQYQLNYKHTTRMVNTWCQKNQCDISNQFEEITNFKLNNLTPKQIRTIEIFSFGSPFFK